MLLTRYGDDGTLYCRHLRAHQRDGVQFMFDTIIGRNAPYFGCILADDMYARARSCRVASWLRYLVALTKPRALVWQGSRQDLTINRSDLHGHQARSPWLSTDIARHDRGSIEPCRGTHAHLTSATIGPLLLKPPSLSLSLSLSLSRGAELGEGVQALAWHSHQPHHGWWLVFGC